MTLDTFFKKFDQFADAPDAVAKMRELVLDLAVQGKLVHQDSREETVDDLLARNDKTRSSMAQNDRRADRDNQSLLSAEDRWMIPDSWSWRALADLVLFVDYRGKTPTKLDEGVRLITAKNVRKGAINLSPEEFLSEKDYHAWMTRGFPKVGDILFTTEAPMGNAAVVKLEGRFALAQRVICFQSYGSIDSSYLVLLILTSQFQFILDKNGTGVTAKGIKASKLKRLPIAVPPLAEQKRIVAKVDELMALCDRLEAQQQERDEQASALARASLARFAEAPTPANLNLLFHRSYSIAPADLRKAILALAVRGKLVPQDSTDESVDALLKCCLSERKKLKRTTATVVQAIAADKAMGYAIPVSWRWQTLDDLLIVGPTNGFSPKAVDYETPVRSLTLSATTSGRFKGEHSKFIEMDLADDADLWLRDGDILVQRGNTLEYVGVPAVYRGEPNQFIYPDLMMKLRVSSAFDVGYIHLAMSHDASRDFLRARASGTSGSMPKINQSALKSLPLPIPPLAEQRRIVAKVDQLMALVDQLETQLAVARSTAKSLLEGVVAELTNQSSSGIQ